MGYSYMNVNEARERLDGINKALTAARVEYQKLMQTPEDRPGRRWAIQCQKEKISKLTQRRVVTEKYLADAVNYEERKGRGRT